MGFLKIILSKIAGAIPSPYQLNPDTWSWNVRDGKAYGLKVNEDGSKEVVAIGGGGQGNDGEDAYCYIAYASDANGTDFTMVFNPDLDYIAIKSTNTAIPAPAVGDFAGLWKNYKGNTGEPGAPGQPGDPGAPGADGDDAYVYIAYASDANGTGFTMVFNAALDYIAIKSTTVPIANPAVGDFAGLWKKYKGEPGEPGAPGQPGDPGAPGADGDDAYVYIAYASDDQGSDFTMTFNGLLNFIAIKTTTTPIAEPQASDFAGLWKQYAGIAPAIGPHYTYVAWCDTPDPENTLGFTLTANLTLPFEAILITHTEISEPTAADFVGLWRPRVTATDLYDKWNLLVDDDEEPQQPITDNKTVFFKRGKGIALAGYTDESDRQVVNIEATNELSIPESNAAEGFKVKLIANEAQAVGDVCFINSSGKAQIANATTIATASARLVCTHSVAADSEATYLIEGIIKVTSLSLTAGGLIYLSAQGTTGNTITQTAPSAADNVIQVLGIALTTDSMFFNPSLSQVVYK